MKSFNEKRVSIKNTKVNGFAKEVPITIIKPNKKSNTLVLFICGLNGKGLLAKYFNVDGLLDEYYIMSYDQRAQGDNLNKSSRCYKRYIDDIDLIVQHIKETMPQIKNIYLVGESWGTSLAILYNKYYPNKVKGTFGWNMPYKPVDITPLKGKAKLKMINKNIFTFLTNIDTYQDSPLAPCLTNNKLLVRISNMNVNKQVSTRVTLAAWRTFKPSWRYLLKTNQNIKYIQSLDDAMFIKSRLDKIKLCKNVEIYEKGYHILSFDLDVQQQLFNDLVTFIKK